MRFSEIADKVKIHGRGAMNAEGLEADWSASGFEMNLKGKGKLTVYYHARKNKDSVKWAFFRAFHDDVPELERVPMYLDTGEGKAIFYIDEGVHSFKLLKSTFAAETCITFTELEFEGEIMDAPPVKDRYLEFVGVSYTGGSSVLGTPKDKVNQRFHDATLAYPYLTAMALDADFSVLAVGGSGVVYSYSDTLIPQTYKARGYFRDPNVLYEFKRRPDVIVLDIGANDRGLGAPPEVFYNNAYVFSKDILALNPGSKIAFLHFPRFRAELEKLVMQLNSEGYSASYIERTWPQLLGGAKHPNITEHQLMSDEIVAHLKNIL